MNTNGKETLWTQWAMTQGTMDETLAALALSSSGTMTGPQNAHNAPKDASYDWSKGAGTKSQALMDSVSAEVYDAHWTSDSGSVDVDVLVDSVLNNLAPKRQVCHFLLSLLMN